MIRSGTPQPSHGGLLYYVVPGRERCTESGRDNPFRPDGDISKEADQIVEAIKSGRPLLATNQDTTDTPTPQSPPVTEPLITTKDAPSPQKASPGGAEEAKKGIGSPGKAGANGTPGDVSSTPGPVEVKHATVTPTDAGHVERVVIKKKNKCSCCVIQ